MQDVEHATTDIELEKVYWICHTGPLFNKADNRSKDCFVRVTIHTFGFVGGA